MVEFSVYSLGNAAFLNEILNGIAAVVGTDDFKRCVAVCMLLSILTVCIQSILNRAQSIEWQNILLGFLIYLVFFSIPTRMVVEDVYSGEVYTVDNIPIGVSASGFVISRIGYGVTDLFETGFGITNRLTQRPYLSSLKYLMHVEGDMSSAAVMEQLDTLSGFKVQPAITEYTKNCIIPVLSRNHVTATNVQNLNINEFLQRGTQEHFGAVQIINENGATSTVSCPRAHEMITDQVIPHLTGDQLNNLFAHYGTVPTAQINLGEAYTTGDALESIGISAGEAQSYMMSCMLMPILAKAASQHFTRLDAMADAMITQALAQRNVQWASEQTMWQQVAQPIMSFFEGFIYGITPIVACLVCLGALGLRLILKYLQTLIWINLWMPVMALCNLYIMMTVSSQVGSLSHGVDTFYGLNATSQILQNQLAVGGMLAAATPMLALFIVTGSNYAFTTLASRLNGSDHVNEKMVRPDIVQQGALLTNAPMYERNATGLTEASGSAPYYAKVSASVGDSQEVASAFQKMNTAQEAYSHTLTNNRVAANQLLNSTSFSKSFAQEIASNSSISSATDRSKLLSLLNSGSLTIGADGKFGFNGNVGANKNLNSKDGEILNRETTGGSVGGNANLHSSVNSTETVSDAEATRLVDTYQAQLQEGYRNSAAKTLTSTGSESATNSDTDAIAHAASNVNSSQQAYSEAAKLSAQNSASMNLGVDQIANAYKTGDLGGDMARAASIRQYALNSQYGGAIQKQAAIYNQRFGLDRERALTAATAQVLLGPSANAEMRSLGNDFVSAIGFGRSSVNGMTAGQNRGISGASGFDGDAGRLNSNDAEQVPQTIKGGPNQGYGGLNENDKSQPNRSYDQNNLAVQKEAYNRQKQADEKAKYQARVSYGAKERSQDAGGVGNWVKKLWPF